MITSLLLTTLSTYGLAFMLTKLDGPFNVFLQLRKLKVFQCFYCTAVWLAPLMAMLHTHRLLEVTTLTLASIGLTYVIYEVIYD